MLFAFPIHLIEWVQESVRGSFYDYRSIKVVRRVKVDKELAFGIYQPL